MATDPRIVYRALRGSWDDPITDPGDRLATSRFRGKVAAGEGRMVTRNVALHVTEQDLRREAGMLDATEVVIELAVAPDAIRVDQSGVKSGRRVDFPGVVVHLIGTRFGDLRYVCDAFECKWSGEPEGWESNVRAVAKGLEALRLVERYGIGRRGEQYRGWGELPPGTPLGERSEPEPLTLDMAARLLAAGMDGLDPSDLLDDEASARTAYRVAAKRVHPDNAATGNAESFRRVNEAWALLEAHHAGGGR